MSYEVTIDRIGAQALFDLKGDAGAVRDWVGDAIPAFPKQPNKSTSKDDATLCHIGPNKWILRAPLNAEDALQLALRPEDAPPDISIVRISDTTEFFRITGQDAAQIMCIGCPLDLHPSEFAENAVSFTEFFGIRALVMRAPGGFDVGVEQSFGNMVADYLARATE